MPPRKCSSSKESADFRFTFAWRGKSRCISIRPPVFYLAISLIPVLCIWYLFATVYLIFRDDMLASLMKRQTEMQYTYEDRVAGLHTEIDRLTSKRLLDEAALQMKMDDLASRQARIERRSAIITSLAERAVPKTDLKVSAVQAFATPAQLPEPHIRQRAAIPASTPNPLLNGAFSSPLPQGVSAFAPTERVPQQATPANSGQANGSSAKPRPDGFDLRKTESLDPAAPASADQSGKALDKTSDRDVPRDGIESLAEISNGLDKIEKEQNRFLANLQTPLIGEMVRVRSALAEAGLSPDRITTQRNNKPEAVGGPFVPMKLPADESAFEHEAAALQEAILAVEQLRRTVSSVPLRKPLSGDPDVTSGFGARVDPFFGRAAMHTGIDLRDDYGTNVHATAAGKVSIAGPDGGYGNLVEIDHGNGFSTRYAHLASIAVSEGQSVEAGQIIGHIGMTGRTTGPHLHYETRIDGEPVDPMRFLKLGNRLFSASPNILSQN